MGIAPDPYKGGVAPDTYEGGVPPATSGMGVVAGGVVQCTVEMRKQRNQMTQGCNMCINLTRRRPSVLARILE